VLYRVEIWEKDVPDTEGDVGPSDRLATFKKENKWMKASGLHHAWFVDRTKSADAPDRWASTT
jgi:hypothetical protein